jgi:hypothetical protein
MENGPVRRCAHCDCDKGGESCKWILPSHAPESVRIKDLTWEAIGEGYWIAESVVGTYRLGSGGSEAAGFWFAWTLEDEDIYSQGTPAESIDAAKAAAQDGYLALITSALTEEPAQQTSHKDLRSTFTQETLVAIAKDALRAAANVYLVWENGGHDYDVENEIMKLSIDDILKPHVGAA